MPIPNRDAVALSARTPGRALFFMRRIVRKLRRWLAAFRDGAGSSSGPSWSRPLASGVLPHRLKKRLPEAWQRAVYRAMGRRRPWALSGWIKSLCCLAIPRWLRQGCARTGIALEADGNEPEDHFGTVLPRRHGCAKRSRMRCLPSCWPRTRCRGPAFPERLLSTMPPTPSIRRWVSWRRRLWRSGRRISPIARGAKTALSLTLRRAGIRRAVLFCRFPSLSHPHLSLLHLRLFPITISQCFPNSP